MSWWATVGDAARDGTLAGRVAIVLIVALIVVAVVWFIVEGA